MARIANADGVSYGPGLAIGGHLQLLLARPLSVTLYYLHASHSVSVNGNTAFGTTDAFTISGSVSSYVLGARFQPTWRVHESVRVWVSMGAAWGILNFPRVAFSAADPYTMATPHHAFVEIPFGVGGQWEFVPRWLALQTSVMWGVAIDEIGPPSVQSVTQGGRLAYTRGLPGFTHSFAATAGVVLEL